MSTTPVETPDLKAQALEIVKRLEGPPRGEDGKFAPADPVAALRATATEPSQEPVASESQESEPKKPTVDPDMGKALTALRRAKIPQSALDKLTDDERLQWGRELSKVQADTDRLLRSKTAKDPDPAKGPAKAADPKAGEPGSPDEGEDGGQEFDRAPAMMRDFLAAQARTTLRDEFPVLADDKAWAEIRAKGIEMFEAGDYDGDDWAEVAVTILRDALYAMGHRPKASAPSAVRGASQPKASKPLDRYATLKGTPRHLLTLKLMENEGMTPQQARETADLLGA